MAKRFLFFLLYVLVSNNTYCQLLSIEKANSLSRMADFYSSSGDYQKSIELEKESLSLRDSLYGNHSPQYAISVYNLSWYYYQFGDINNALKYGKEDLLLCSEIAGKNSEAYSNSLANMELYCRTGGYYNDAINYGNMLLSLYKDLYGEKIEYAYALHNISMDYANIGDYPNAISLTEKSIGIKEEYNKTDDLGYAMSINNLAEYYSKIDNYTKACELQKEAVDLVKKVLDENHPEYAKCLGNLGNYLIRVGEYDKAILCMKEAWIINERTFGKEDPTCAVSLNSLAYAYSLKMDLDSAIVISKKALSLCKNIEPYYSTLLSNIALYYEQKNDFPNATVYISQAIRAIKDRMRNELVGLDLQGRYLYWQNVHSYFDDIYPYYVAQNKDSSYISDLYNTILFRNDIVVEKNASKCFESNWKDIYNVLNTDDIAIEFVSGSKTNESIYHYYALLLRKNQKNPEMIYLYNSEEFIDSLKNAESEEDKQRKVSSLVWNKLLPYFEGIKNIFFSPTFVLHVIPIEYLPINDNELICDKFNLFRLSSTKRLIDSRQRKSYKNAILFGGLNYENTSSDISKKRSGFEQLTFTDSEVNDIADIFEDSNIKCAKYTDFNGTEEMFKNLSGRAIDILHVSTHGMYVSYGDSTKLAKELPFVKFDNLIPNYYLGNAFNRSFLVLSGGNKLITNGNVFNNQEDGLLTALEISDIDFSNLDLVVLSACDTGLGEYGSDDGILGLQKGFKSAGANSIIMSLKKVDDEATKILMVEFYRNLMRGKTKYQSLKDAQKYLRKADNGKYDKPEYWASFIMLDGLN